VKLPKTVIINARLWTVVVDNCNVNSHFSYRDRKITVGAGNPQKRGDVLRGLMHEVAEISAVERGVRYTRDKELGGNGDYLFCGNHDQFDDIISDLSLVIGGLIR